MTPGGGDRFRGEDNTVSQNEPCMVIRAQRKYSQ